MAARIGGFLVDVVFLSLLGSVLVAIFGIEYVTSSSRVAGGFGYSTSQFELGGPWGWLLWPAYFLLFWLLFRSSPGQMLVCGGGIRSRERMAILAAIVLGFVSACLAFDYYGRPPLVIQGAVNTHRLLNVPASYSLGEPTRSGNSIIYPLNFRDAARGRCTGQVELEWEGFIRGWTFGPADSVCHLR